MKSGSLDREIPRAKGIVAALAGAVLAAWVLLALWLEMSPARGSRLEWLRPLALPGLLLPALAFTVAFFADDVHRKWRRLAIHGCFWLALLLSGCAAVHFLWIRPEILKAILAGDGKALGRALSWAGIDALVFAFEGPILALASWAALRVQEGWKPSPAG